MDNEVTSVSKWEREIWSSDEPNSIRRSIRRMLEENFLFLIKNKAGFVCKVDLLSHLTFQHTYIRRLTEQQATRPEKKIISLTSLLEEIQNNSRFLNTEDGYIEFLDVVGEPVTSLAREHYQALLSDPHKRQSKIDALSAALQSKVIKNANEFFHKLIAHAANEFSRSEKTEWKNHSNNLTTLEEIHETLCKVCHDICAVILYQGQHEPISDYTLNDSDILISVLVEGYGADEDSLQSFKNEHLAKVNGWFGTKQ